MLEHSLAKEKDKTRRLDNDNHTAQRELTEERFRRREAEEKSNRMAIDNSNLTRQNDDLKYVFICHFSIFYYDILRRGFSAGAISHADFIDLF